VSVAWSCNGSTLAVAYGKTNHETWCEHHSVVSTWGIFRREFDPKKPTLSIEVPNCLTTIEFHPSDPLILAGGTINGEIYLWNIDSERNGEDSLICNSSIDEYYHREAVTKLIWMKYESMTSLSFQYCLLSVSTDAKILVWRLADKLRYPAKGHLLARKKDGELATVGGTSFCKVHGGAQDEQTFIVGTEGGSIFKCSIQEPQDKDISHFFETNTGGLRWK
jgi:WD40 repeat protein